MDNKKIADTFERVADLLEFQGANPFRIRAYRRGARTIRELTESVAVIVSDSRHDLTSVEGIGKDLAAKCTELVETGTLEMLHDLTAEIPDSVLDLLRIPGLGPKKAAVLFRELGIKSLEQLQEACQAGQVAKLKGFGKKTEVTLLKGIALAASANQRIYWSDADVLVTQLRTHLEQSPTIERLEFAGSYRRGRETVGDLDILVVAKDSTDVMDRLRHFEESAETLVRGRTKMSVRLESGLQVDLRVVPPESFGAALQYFTGSKDHNVIVRAAAKRLGLKINEYGVYQDKNESDSYLSGAEEVDVYHALGMPWFPPELREARQEFRWAEEGKLPDLVELGEIRGDLHMHTNATDGRNTIEEMVAAAQSRQLQYIAITDHSKRVSMAQGLDTERLLAQWKEIDQINQQIGEQFELLKGVECDILEEGGMDLPDHVLAKADWVLASVHYGQKQSEEKITDRIIGAIRNPHVDAIAHPTGRLINRREPYEVNMEALLQAAAEYHTLMELNANPVRLDLNDVHCAAAKAAGIPLVINTDAHSSEGLEVMRCGIIQARRAGLAHVDVANTMTWSDLLTLLNRD